MIEDKDKRIADLERGNDAYHSQVMTLTNERNRLRERVKERAPSERQAAMTAWTMGFE